MAASQARTLRIVGAAFDADRALADRRQHLVLGHRRADMRHAESLQAGQGQQRRLDDAGLALGQPRVDIAAQIDDLEVGPAMQELGAPAQRRGADDRALPEVGDAPDVARDQHVARILARQEGGDDEAGGCAVGMSFMLCTATSMRRDSSASSISLTNRPLPPASDRGRSWMASPVVLIGDDLDGIGRGERGHRGGQCVAHQAGLDQGELAAARAESQEGSRHGAALA